jgi:hypothetical protein
MAIQTAEDTATADTFAPTVRFEPCAEFGLDHDSPWAVCDTCGWLDDDHTRPDTPIAVVTELPRRAAPVPERKAS